MHISEGVLSLPVLASGGVLTGCGTLIGLRRLDYDHIMTTALLASTFFVASLIHIPLGPGSVHLVFSGLLGLLLGWAAVPAIVVALLLQALLFQHGGLSVLGVNGVIMGAPAVVVWYLFRSWIVTPGTRRKAGAFLTGFVAVLLSTLLLAGALVFSGDSFVRAAQILVLAHVPVMIIEGIVTMFVVGFLARVQPEMFQTARGSRP